MDKITDFLRQIETKEKIIKENQIYNELKLYDDILELIDYRVENENIQYDNSIQAIIIEKCLILENELDQIDKMGV